MPKAAVFDAYGTLLDVHSAIAAQGAALGEAGPAVSALWRAKQLERTWILSAVGDYEPFDLVTDQALGHALAVHGAGQALRPALLSAYRQLAAWPDAADTLSRLRGRGLATSVLSNGSPDMLADALGHAALAPLLDHVLSVHTLRRYKPHPSVYRLACEAHGCQPHEIAFVSANAWDAFGAARFGFRVLWLNRTGALAEYWLDRLATIVPALSAVPDAMPA